MSVLRTLCAPVVLLAVAAALTPACAMGVGPETGGEPQSLPSGDGGDETSGSSGTSGASGVSQGAGTTPEDPATTADETTTGAGDDETTSGSSAGASTGAVDPSPTGSGDDSSDGGSTGALVDGFDLSGFTLRQANSAREFRFPQGVVLGPDQSLLVVREAPLPSFETFWSVTVGTEVIVLDGAGEFPAINGDETYTLLDPQGIVVDGPTPALDLGAALVRDEPVEGDVWTMSNATVDAVSPGTGSVSDGDGRPYIAELADAPGNGTYGYEYIELRLR